MKTPFNLLQQLVKEEQQNNNNNFNNQIQLQEKKSKPIRKQTVKNIKTAKLDNTRKYKSIRKSQFYRSPQQDLSTEEPFSPIMHTMQNPQTNYLNSCMYQESRCQRQQSSGLIKLCKISSEQSSKFHQNESEISTNYDDDSQLIDESMRSVSSSSILIQSEENDQSDEILRNEQNTQSNFYMMSDFQRERHEVEVGLSQPMPYEKNQIASNDATQDHTPQSIHNNIYNDNQNSNIINPKKVDCCTQINEFQVKPIFFMPGVPSTEKILQGESIIFKDHYKEILMYYDIIPVSRSFIEGASINKNGVFFEVKPTNLDSFWAQKSQEFPRLAGFINRGNSN